MKKLERKGGRSKKKGRETENERKEGHKNIKERKTRGISWKSCLKPKSERKDFPLLVIHELQQPASSSVRMSKKEE